MDHSGHDMSTMAQSGGGMNHVMMMSVRKKHGKIIFKIEKLYFFDF